MRLKDKVAIVTGAAAGIGRAIAELFAGEGARVALCDIRAELGEEVATRIRSAGGEASFVRCDVSQADEVEALVRTTVSRYGRLDILVNNAARWAGDGVLLEVSEAIWDDTLDACLRSVYLCSKYAIPPMAAGGWGSIVNIASVNALFGVHLAAYTAAKGGVIALTRLMAVQYGGQGIRANVICPGTIETETTRTAFEERPKLRERLQQALPLKRLGRPDDVAYCALYLASPESDFVTGAIFVIDGGLTAGMKIEG
ncbi:MAG: SDR family NAD(P)-dependent oxidoreductase [Acidobacteriota bacterium]|nr:SDR family oxidoreductase [Blastocatellia bacterium]MDW8240969.1 SDR family NAD(P)-dependent oxidoreductase [Acidobacteriota bacterium]